PSYPLPLPPRLTLSPYTTLFRSLNNTRGCARGCPARAPIANPIAPPTIAPVNGAPAPSSCSPNPRNQFITRKPAAPKPTVQAQRSEEHTSELQSRVDLVCRLLLE